jgi:hypothetical protein
MTTATAIQEVRVIQDALWDLILSLRARAAAEAADDRHDAAEESDTVASVLILATDKLAALPDLITEDYRQIADDAVAAWETGGQDF